MALFYSHAIFQKKVSSGSDSCSMAGLSSKPSLVLAWILQHYKTSLTSNFLNLFRRFLLGYTRVSIKLNVLSPIIVFGWWTWLAGAATNFVQVTV